jgi:glutaconate CoA-transferase subunit A
MNNRPDWHVMANPFAADDDPILLLPALVPDIAAFHASCADAEGNVWVGRRRELATMAHASRTSVVTVERIVPGRLLDNEQLAPGVISGVYIKAIAIAERGAWPGGLLDEYPADRPHIADYARIARSEAGFAEYLARHVLHTATQDAA